MHGRIDEPQAFIEWSLRDSPLVTCGSPSMILFIWVTILISYFSVGSGPTYCGHFMVNYVQSWSQKKEIRVTHKLARFIIWVLTGWWQWPFFCDPSTRRYALTLRLLANLISFFISFSPAQFLLQFIWFWAGEWKKKKFISSCSFIFLFIMMDQFLVTQFIWLLVLS